MAPADSKDSTSASTSAMDSRSMRVSGGGGPPFGDAPWKSRRTPSRMTPCTQGAEGDESLIQALNDPRSLKGIGQGGASPHPADPGFGPSFDIKVGKGLRTTPSKGLSPSQLFSL